MPRLLQYAYLSRLCVNAKKKKKSLIAQAHSHILSSHSQTRQGYFIDSCSFIQVDVFYVT